MVAIQEPELSICIPTFSRKKFLENILSQLIELIEFKKFNIEVCIADNCSNDDTWTYLVKASENKDYIKIKSHPKNIGGNRNLIDITSMASAKWILVVGDDDMLIPDGLSSLLKILPTLDEVDYILLNTKLDANNNLLKLNAGFQDLDSIKNSLLNSINEYGFCGSHLMSQAVAQNMRGRTYEHLRTWPSFGTFINNAFPLNKKIYFFETPVVWQDANGQAMTWQPTDWLKLLVRMQNVFLINLDAYSDKQFCKHVVQNNVSSILFFKSFYRALIYSRTETLNVLRSEEYLNLMKVISLQARLSNYAVIFFIRLIPNFLTYFIIKRILRKNLEDYVYTGNLDEKDGISQDPEILTKSNEL
jgi:glycosyltransferase involved in cell wall biosynthesis